jgi:hypothetical protein
VADFLALPEIGEGEEEEGEEEEGEEEDGEEEEGIKVKSEKDEMKIKKGNIGFVSSVPPDISVYIKNMSFSWDITTSSSLSSSNSFSSSSSSSSSSLVYSTFTTTTSEDIPQTSNPITLEDITLIIPKVFPISIVLFPSLLLLLLLFFFLFIYLFFF